MDKAKETLHAFRAHCRRSSMRINHFLITNKLAALCQCSDGLSVRLTHNESLCVRELLEEFPEVLIALLVCGAQHLQERAHWRYRPPLPKLTPSPACFIARLSWVICFY